MRALFRKRAEDDQPPARPPRPRAGATRPTTGASPRLAKDTAAPPARPVRTTGASTAPQAVRPASGAAKAPADASGSPRPSGYSKTPGAAVAPAPPSGATKLTKTPADAAGSAQPSGTTKLTKTAPPAAGSPRPSGATKATAAGQTPAKPHHVHSPANPITSRPLVNPNLRKDPRLRIWVIRAVVSVLIYLGFMFALGWRIGLTAAVIYIAADTLYRTRTVAIVPTSVRVTSAQRYTRRRLKVLHSAGYLALNARRIPDTHHVIDHLVVGPAGVYSMDSQHMDKRLELRVKGGEIFYGQENLEKRLEHAQHEAEHAARLIGAELGRKIRIRPVMVLYGPAVTWTVMPLSGVDVLEGSRIGAYFRKQTKDKRGKLLNASQISAIYRAAARALPPLTEGHRPS